MPIKIGTYSGNVLHYCQPYALYVRESSGTVFLSTVVMPLFHWPANPRRSYGVRKKITDTQQDRRDGLVEHLRRYYFACVVYQLRINDAWVTHMRRIWRMNGDATAYDVAYENLTIAYSRCKWRMHSVHPTYARRPTLYYGVWRAYVQRMGCVLAELMKTHHNMWAVNVTFTLHVVENICIWMSCFICPIW